MSRNLYTPHRCCVCSKRIREDRAYLGLRGGLHGHTPCVERAGLVDHIDHPSAASNNPLSATQSQDLATLRGTATARARSKPRTRRGTSRGRGQPHGGTIR